ncbi:MAG: FGGY family carbohydrate kinase, partial [Anaerolineae bacterium]|nr:FGGY family carbohydrate kinase [Anaerolineae bacterium]
MQRSTSVEHVRISGRRPDAPDLLLGLDVGTTTTRALVFDLAGQPVAEAYREVAIAHPRPGWAELDAEQCWRATIEVIGEVLSVDESFSRRLLAIGLTGLLHALVPVDTAGNPLASAMLWLDHRCAPQAAWLWQQHGDLIRSTTGARGMNSSSSGPKLRWLVEHEPALVEQAAVFLPMKDFIRLRLTGRIATDPSDAAGTALVDNHSGEWCAPLLAAIGISLGKLPPIRGSAEVIGAVTAEAAQATGLAAGIPVVVGAGDTTCTRIGADAEGTGRACIYMGTAAWIAAPQRQAGCFAATATTGAALRWLVGLFDPAPGQAASAAYTVLLEEAASAPRGAASLLFLPHLMGERGPAYNPKAKGVLFGLTLAHGRAEITRAVLEGCAFHIRSILDQLCAEP